ncbi:MAG: hypothetical protein ACW98X_20775 [Promethearchaeota archaeon]
MKFQLKKKCPEFALQAALRKSDCLLQLFSFYLDCEILTNTCNSVKFDAKRKPQQHYDINNLLGFEI